MIDLDDFVKKRGNYFSCDEGKEVYPVYPKIVIYDIILLCAYNIF